MTILDVAIVNVAIPSIQIDLNIDESTVQWVITAYAITFGGFLLLGGRMADLLGRKRIFLVGLTCSRSPRSFAGSPTARRADRRARGAGPRRGDHLAGGALDRDDDLPRGRRAEQGARDLGRARRLGRRGGRALRRDPDQVPRLGVDLLRQRAGRRARVRRWRSPSSPRARADLGHRRFDAAGAVTVTGGLALLVYAISKAPDVGWGSARTILLLLASAALLAAFVLIERRTARRWCRSGSSGTARSPARTSSASCSAR